MPVISDREKINRSYPFLKNFPFSDKFEIYLNDGNMGEMPFAGFGFEMVAIGPTSPSLEFKYKNSPMKITISISEKELLWITEAGERVKKMDRIAKRLDLALKSKSIIKKRDVCIEADEWLTKVTDGNRLLSNQILNDALTSIAGPIDVPEAVSIVNAMNKLFSKKGLICLSKKEANTIITFLQFKLIYTKLMLGLVISSKISM